MAQVGIETLYEDIGLPVSQPGGPVHRTAVTVGTLLAQVVRQLDLHAFAADRGHMQVFVVRLRRAETGGVRQARLKILGGLIKQVDAGTEYQLVYQVVLIQTGADEHGQHIHLPLVLHEGAGDAYILPHVAVIARHDIMHGVVLILQSARKGGGGEEAVVHIAYVHAACHPGQVVRLAVGVHILLCAVVAVAVGVLDRAVQRYFMLILAPEEVVAQSAAVDDVPGLLGDVRFVRLKVELVAAAAEFVGSVILQVDAAEMRGTVIGAEAESIHVQLAQFGETVTVAVVRIAVAVAFVEGDSIGIVFGHQRDVPAHVLLPGLAVHIGEHA